MPFSLRYEHGIRFLSRQRRRWGLPCIATSFRDFVKLMASHETIGCLSHSPQATQPSQHACSPGGAFTNGFRCEPASKLSQPLGDGGTMLSVTVPCGSVERATGWLPMGSPRNLTHLSIESAGQWNTGWQDPTFDSSHGVFSRSTKLDPALQTRSGLALRLDWELEQ